MAHTVTFIFQVICAIASFIGIYVWFAEANVTFILELYGAYDAQNTLTILAMAPLFFCLNATNIIPPKWRDVFRVIAAFFFLNHFEVAVCDAKIAFDKLSTNETIDAQLNLTPDSVRLTWAALLFILGSSGISFVVAFLLEPILIAAFGNTTSPSSTSPASPSSSPNNKQRIKRKRKNNNASGDSGIETSSNTGSEANNRNVKTVTISIGAPLKIAYVVAALLVIAAMAVLIATGDACNYFSSTNPATQRQLSQTFPAIAFLLLTGSALNDARALDIAVSMLMMNVLNWQPTDYDINVDSEHNMLTISALLQSAGDLVIVFTFLHGILEARRHKINFVANMRSFNFRLTCACWIFGFVGAALVLNHPNAVNSQIWIASFSGFVVPVFGIGAAVFGAEACFVPSAFVGLRASTLIAESLQGTNGQIRYGWLLLILSNFGGCVSAIKMINDPNFVSEEEGSYERIPEDSYGNDAAAANQTQLKRRNAEEMFEWIRSDSRVFTGFLLALVSALSIRSTNQVVYNDFLRAMYLAILVIVSLAGRDSAGTIVMLVAASFVSQKELWYIDNDPTLINLVTFIFAAALWMFLLFNRDHFPYLPMHSSFAQEVVDYSLARNATRIDKRERTALNNNNNVRDKNAPRSSNADDGYGAC